VKNNLQVVSSLLSINGSGHLDDAVRAAFEESRRQVRAISLAHEALYLSERVAEVHLPDYIRSIVSELARIVDRPGVGFTVEAEPVSLGIDRAVPFGLLVNELATNALKHAFPGGREGRISIGLKRVGELSARLSVEDDGIGFGSQPSPATKATMGMRLAKSLAAQVGGSLQVDGEKGAAISLEFPL
jgi:two-component system, sensor histidine kinase PdtaS